VGEGAGNEQPTARSAACHSLRLHGRALPAPLRAHGNSRGEAGPRLVSAVGALPWTHAKEPLYACQLLLQDLSKEEDATVEAFRGELEQLAAHLATLRQIERSDPSLPAGDVVQDLPIEWVRYDDPEVKAFKLNAERNNGRAAMLGILGMISHTALGQDALFPIVSK